MKNKDAAKYLKDHFNPAYPDGLNIKHDDAINTAIRALEASDWNEVTSASPPLNKPVLLGIKYEDKFTYIVTERYTATHWKYLGSDDMFICDDFKWRELPPSWEV